MQADQLLQMNQPDGGILRAGEAVHVRACIGLYEESLYLPLRFAVNLKLL